MKDLGDPNECPNSKRVGLVWKKDLCPELEEWFPPSPMPLNIAPSFKSDGDASSEIYILNGVGTMIGKTFSPLRAAAARRATKKGMTSHSSSESLKRMVILPTENRYLFHRIFMQFIIFFAGSYVWNYMVMRLLHWHQFPFFRYGAFVFTLRFLAPLVFTVLLFTVKELFLPLDSKNSIKKCK